LQYATMNQEDAKKMVGKLQAQMDEMDAKIKEAQRNVEWEAKSITKQEAAKKTAKDDAARAAIDKKIKASKEKQAKDTKFL
jgi:hypothetical protein